MIAGNSFGGDSVRQDSRRPGVFLNKRGRLVNEGCESTIRLDAGSEGRRRDRIASAAMALLFALLLGFFLLGRGPGSLVWLNGSTPPWLPFAGSGLSWLPYHPSWLPFGGQAN